MAGGLGQIHSVGHYMPNISQNRFIWPFRSLLQKKKKKHAFADSSLPIFIYFKQILQVTAVDLDTGNNARLTYRIVGGDQLFQHQSSFVQGQYGGNTNSNSQRNVSASSMLQKPPNTSTPLADDVSELFGIFPNSGWIYLRGTLDRETREQYDITVLASDNGTPSATATTHVIVNVLDANDNDPTFSRDSYEFSVEENVKRGAVVGILSATDADMGVNAAIRYSIIPSNTSFQVNPNTG